MLTQDRTVKIGSYSFNEEGHKHLWEGKPMYGTTTILKMLNPLEYNEKKGEWESKMDRLIGWSIKKSFEYLKANFKGELTDELIKQSKAAPKGDKTSAGASGTEIHKHIETWINESMTGSIKLAHGLPQVQNFINWAIRNEVKFLASEQHVFDNELFVAGICDFVCEIKGKMYVGDIKTGSGIYPEAKLQTSIYADMLVTQKMFPKFDGIVIVNIKKDGSFDESRDVEFNYDLEGNIRAFKNLVQIFKQINAIK